MCEFVLIEYEENKVYSGFEKCLNMCYVIIDIYCMIVYKDLEIGEFYDCKVDLNEIKNLWDCFDFGVVKFSMMFILS